MFRLIAKVVTADVIRLPILFLFSISQFLISSNTVFASWEKTYGGTKDECGRAVKQTTDGGYIIAGYTRSYGAGFYDVYLIKTNSAGDTSWTRTYGGADFDFGWSVIQTTTGEYITVGELYNESTKDDIYLIKTGSAGNTSWTRTYGGTEYDEGRSVDTTSGGYIIAGYTKSFGIGTPDYYNVYLIKTNSDGDTIWTRTYGGSGSDRGYSVKQTSDGGYIIAGATNSYGASGYNVYLIKTDSDGNTSWEKVFGGDGNDHGRSVAQTSDGGYIIAGYTDSYGAGYDVYLIKTNSAGDTTWTRTYGGSGDDRGYSVVQTTDGGYIIAGCTKSFGIGTPDSSNVYLIKTKPNGDTSWTRTYGGTGNDYGYSVAQTLDGGYIITGEKAQPGGTTEGDVYLIKVDDGSGVAEESVFEPNKSGCFSLNIVPTVGTSNFKISYYIPNGCGRVTLQIYDVTGRVVRLFPLTTVSWDGTDSAGEDVDSGVYFCQLTVGDRSITKKMIVMR
ncbi:MAG: T9SS type A sorting domain-containing protein [bacterium]|nr:T9SS type A sorting domain-containing protein [bacterium]